MVRKRPEQRPCSIWDAKLLVEFLDRHDIKPVHCKTIWQTLVANEGNFDALIDTSLPRRIVPFLKQDFTYCSSKLSMIQQDSLDGTIKLLIQLQDQCEIETVIINHTGEDVHGVAMQTSSSTPVELTGQAKGLRKTLCVSSQIGCKLGCTFCATGTMKLEGNCTAGEIMEQLLTADHVLNFLEMRRKLGLPSVANSDSDAVRDLIERINSTHTKWEARHINNVVFMGMGEPLENFENVCDALLGMTDRQRFGLAIRNCTVSTVGIVPKMKALLERIPAVKLTLSLHAPNQHLREQIVPVSQSYHIDTLMQVLDEYAEDTADAGKKKGFVLCAYIMIRNVNDKQEHLEELVALVKERQVVINLIPFNKFDLSKVRSHPSQEYEASEQETIDNWVKQLNANGIRAFERRPHGREIAAACGQLAKIKKDVIEDIEGPNPERISRCVPLSKQVLRNQKHSEYLKRRDQTPKFLWGAGVLAGLAAILMWAMRRNRPCLLDMTPLHSVAKSHA